MDDHWRWWAAWGAVARRQLHQRDAGWGEWSGVRRALGHGGPPALAAPRCGYAPCEARTSLPRRGLPRRVRRGQPRRLVRALALRVRVRESQPVRGPVLVRQRRPPLPQRPWPWPWRDSLMALLAARHDGGRRCRRGGGYGPLGRPQWTPRSSKPESPACQRGRAAPCSLDRALSRARVPGSSSAPKRSLTSVCTSVHTVPYSFTTGTDTNESMKTRQLLTSSSLSERRSAF